MVAVDTPIGGPQMNLDIANGHRFVGAVIFPEPHCGLGEIGTAAVIPESRLDDLDRATVVDGQDRSVVLLKPKGLHFKFGGRRNRFLSQ